MPKPRLLLVIEHERESLWVDIVGIIGKIGDIFSRVDCKLDNNSCSIIIKGYDMNGIKLIKFGVR
jgi:hypothetical protein